MSDGERCVTLLLAEIDAHKRTLNYVNSHNPALLSRAKNGHGHALRTGSVDLIAGAVLVSTRMGSPKRRIGLERIRHEASLQRGSPRFIAACRGTHERYLSHRRGLLPGGRLPWFSATEFVTCSLPPAPRRNTDS